MPYSPTSPTPKPSYPPSSPPHSRSLRQSGPAIHRRPFSCRPDPQTDRYNSAPGGPMQELSVVLQLSGTCDELLDLQHGVIARWQIAHTGYDVRIVDPQLRSG